MAVHYEDSVVMAQTLEGLTGFERGEGQCQACQMVAHCASPEAGNGYRWDGYHASLLASTLWRSGRVWRETAQGFIMIIKGRVLKEVMRMYCTNQSLGHNSRKRLILRRKKNAIWTALDITGI